MRIHIRNGRVVDPATVPSSAFAPNKKQIVGIAAAVTLVAAAMLALLLDRLANTLNSTTDVENRLRVPALGVLQKVKGFAKKGFVSELAFFNDTQSTFSEAVRTVRTRCAAGSTPTRTTPTVEGVPRPDGALAVRRAWCGPPVVTARTR